MWFVLKTVEDGAQMPVFLALSRKLGKSNGQYFREFAVHDVVDKCQDPAACERLYEESRRAVSLDVTA
ncbi:hypothetical protein Aduo_015975 [Ancylostoma duodenale]